jgi:tRNA A-37 threonylcarbamoyl transferase component Bud32
MGAAIASESELGATTSDAGFVPAEPLALAPHFPDLVILELLGHGGMGAVYKARQTKLDRLVALKIIRPELAGRPEFAARFHREARTLARLSHPNIVAVYDFGEVTVSNPEPDNLLSRTVYYFLMEYVDGTTLRQLIHAGRLQPQQALAIVPQICEALQFAHDEGVVHRDIKPENILLDQRGRVKIADFGLARLLNTSPQDYSLTDADQVMGTPRYMAPEQMEGSHEVDHRADIFSLGVVFYEMLTGQTPAGHFDPPSKKVQIDVRLDEVVLRSMAREPERRYQQAREVKSEVEWISQSASAKPGEIPVAATVDNGAATTTEGADFVEVESDLNGPSIAMMVVGLLIAASHCMIVIAGMINRFHPEPVIVGFPGIVIGAAMFVGGLSMRRLRSRGWAQVGAVAGVIPASAGWLVGIPIALWAHFVLQRPEVRRAFIERARQRQAGAIPPEPPRPSKSDQRPGGAIRWTVFHSVLWAALFAAFLLLVPAFQGMFDDFGVEVPGLTLLMIKISYGLSRFWHIVVPLGMVGMAFDFAILFLLGKVGRRVQSLAGLLLLLVPLALGGLLLLSLGLPMARLIEALS